MRAATTRRLGHERWLQPGFAARVADRAGGVDIVRVRHDGGALATDTIRARHAVSAMPLHVLARIWPGLAGSGYDAATHASPHAAWLVSNFLVDGYARELPGEALAWDNVVYGGAAWATSCRRTRCCAWRRRRARCCRRINRWIGCRRSKRARG